jgi:hypothetical protein
MSKSGDLANMGTWRIGGFDPREAQKLVIFPPSYNIK